MPEQSEHLNRVDAAKYVGRCVSTLDKWRSENVELPYYQTRRKVWYLKSDLDDYLSRYRVEPVAVAKPRRRASGCPEVAQEQGVAA